jgi:hypothetical protein
VGAINNGYFSKELISLALVLVVGGMITSLTMIILMQRLLALSVDKVRLVISLAIMLACFGLAIKMPIHTTGLYQNLALLLVSGTLAVLLMLAMLWRNPALTRLLSTSLRTDYR